MVELLGSQNAKIVELLGVKFVQKAFFSKFLLRRDRIDHGTTLYITLKHIG